MTHLPYFSAFESIPPEYESQLLDDAAPQYFKAETGSNAVAICLHGFTGMPYEVCPVAKAFAERGIDAVVPLLPGHGYRGTADQRRHFPRMTVELMHEAVRREIVRARQDYEHVGMFGLSMGGAIALSMASEGLLDVCAVAAPALRLPDMAESLVPLLGWANFFIPKRREPKFYLPSYRFYNSWALRELRRIGRHAHRNLSKITCPVLVVHSRCDRTISPIVADWVEQDVTGEVEVQWFDQSGHCMPLDVQGQELSESVAAFFQRQLYPDAPAEKISPPAIVEFYGSERRE